MASGNKQRKGVNRRPFVVSLSNYERPFVEQQDRPFDKLRASGLTATHLLGVWGWEYVILRE